MAQENVELVAVFYADFGLSPRLVEAAASRPASIAGVGFDNFSPLWGDLSSVFIAICAKTA
jgi:hypothetical protein